MDSTLLQSYLGREVLEAVGKLASSQRSVSVLKFSQMKRRGHLFWGSELDEGRLCMFVLMHQTVVQVIWTSQERDPGRGASWESRSSPGGTSTPMLAKTKSSKSVRRYSFISVSCVEEGKRQMCRMVGYKEQG